MNKGVLIGGGVGLLMLLVLGAYWMTVREPVPQQPAVQNTVPGTTAPSGAVGSSAASVQPGTAPIFPPTLPPPSSNSGSTADAAMPSPVAIPQSASGSAAPAKPIASAEKKPLTREERREIRAQVSTKMNELLAKGQKVTPADTLAFLNDVEKLGQGLFDPQYFSTMREMVGYSARTQDLSRELNQIANSKAPKDIARQQAILAELRDIGDRISNGAAALQSYARDAATVKTP